MDNKIKVFSTTLAVLLTLGLIACGTSSPDGDRVSSPDLNPNDPPGVETLAYPPVVKYNMFAPKTEAELKGVYKEGGHGGRPIANYGYMIARTKPGFDPAVFAKHGLEVRGSLSANGSRYWHLYKESGLIDVMEKVKKMNGLLYIEPEIMYYTTAGLVYNNPDPLITRQEQYGALTTHTKRAWETYGFGPNRPVVVDIDTGVNYNHEDLTNVVTHAFSWFEEWGWDVLPGGSPLSDPEPVDWRVAYPDGGWLGFGSDPELGHGTHTAGTMAAEGNNGLGVAGMCWNVDLVSYRGLNNTGSGGDWTIYGSLWHLARWKKANYPHTIPVNMSLGSGWASQFCADMIEMALEHDVVICASSGNDASGFFNFPSSITGAIRVGAVNMLDKRVYFSSWGQDMSVMAPGEYVLSTAFDDYYVSSGTSMAAPHVTGLVGYMLTFAPDLKPDQIRTYLERNADPIEGQQGFDPRVGHGRINTYRTIGAVIDDINNNRVPASNYAMTPVKVTVKNTSGQLIKDAIVYLYNSTQDGTITNYAGLAPTGASFVNVRDDSEIPPENGVAWFNMLKPGWYKVATNYSVPDLVTGETNITVAESPVFEVRRGLAVAPMTLTLDIQPLLYVQTYPTGNYYEWGEDTCIAVYDANGLLLDYDFYLYDTVCFNLSKPGEYWINIYPYLGGSTGEYAMWLGDTLQPEPAPGTFDEPGPNGIQGSQAHDQANAQLIRLNDKVVYGVMTWDDWYTGDWYKFIIE